MSRKWTRFIWLRAISFSRLLIPYFYKGRFKGEELSGIGSPHTPAGMIWPLAQEMQGMTTNQSDE